MKYLLDVNVLLAAIWANHSRHAETFAWLDGKSIVLCPLCELGFLRISTHTKAINAPMDKARQLLRKFSTERQAERIHDDLPVLDSRPTTSEQVTDHYLADLAASHGLKLATLDMNVEHAEVVRVAKPESARIPDETSGV